MILLAVLCAAVSWLVARRAPQHRPVAIALTLCAAIDALRHLVLMPPRVSLALCLLAPAISMWCYAKVWRCPSNDTWHSVAATWGAMALFVLFANDAASWWNVPMVALYAVAVAIGLLAILTRWRAPWTVSQRTAAMLLAGDVAALVLLCARETISYQAGVVLGLVMAYQLWWLWRYRCPN